MALQLYLLKFYPLNTGVFIKGHVDTTDHVRTGEGGEQLGMSLAFSTAMLVRPNFPRCLIK